MATINFLYRSTKDKAPLNLRLLFRYNGKDFVYGAKTKLEVTKHYWNKEHNQKRPKDIEISNKQVEINKELNRIENHILESLKTADLNDVNKDWLTNVMELYYNPVQATKTPKNIVDYIDFYIDYRKHDIRPTSITKFLVIKHKLERLQAHRKRTILIKDIDEVFKNEFIEYQKENGYAKNTIQRELAFIKTICKHARYMGMETNPQLDNLRTDKAKADKNYLNIKELEQIEQTDCKHDYLENAKDWLIISCYTGQRVSDFLRFDKSMIRVENGKSFIEFTQKKTGKLMTIPLHKKVLGILDKRNGEFPRKISDQRYNEFIKEVCRIAGINELTHGSKQQITKQGIRKVSGKYPKWELVTSHIGRRSFATNYYGKIATTFLIYVTGHSSETMFLNYIGKSNKDIALEISKYF